MTAAILKLNLNVKLIIFSNPILSFIQIISLELFTKRCVSIELFCIKVKEKLKNKNSIKVFKIDENI
jgi:hypothetical protein